MKLATDWLEKRGVKQQNWFGQSIKTPKKLDRAGKASAKSFMYISHSRLVEIVEWDLIKQNAVQAAGAVW